MFIGIIMQDSQEGNKFVDVVSIDANHMEEAQHVLQRHIDSLNSAYGSNDGYFGITEFTHTLKRIK